MSIVANESTIPILACFSITAMKEFYEALGFRASYRQERPYVYLAMRWSGFEIHFRKPPKGSVAAHEDVGATIVYVDDVACYHDHMVSGLRAIYGKTPTKGLPRITRYRVGATRFTIYDPSGNAVIFVARSEPWELEYGGAAGLVGLAKAIDQARIYREFKNDNGAALRLLTSALRRHHTTATVTERRNAVQMMIELARDLDDHSRASELEAELAKIDLATPPKRDD